MGQVSRRQLLQGAALAGAGILGAGALAACSPLSADEADGTSPAGGDGSGATPDLTGRGDIGLVKDAEQTEDADIVVVGSGIGGFTASMIAKEQAPEASVLMLEKNQGLGGSTNFAECNGPAANVEEHEAHLQGMQRAANTGYIANTLLHYERVREQGDNADWLFQKHGVVYEQPGPGPYFYQGGNGASAIEHLTPQAEELGVDIRRDARVTALLTSDEHTVTGVQYETSSGQVVHVNAKAVILATGGLSTNMELLKEYCGQEVVRLTGWGQGQDGDGQLLVEQTAHGRAKYLCLGSLFNNIGEGDNGGNTVAYDSPLGVACAMQYTNLYINQDGLRYCDESCAGAAGTEISGKLVESQPYVFSIADAAHLAKYEAGGCTRHYSGFADKLVGNPTDLQSDLELYAGQDYFFKADTLEDLAAQIKAKVPYFDADAFLASIATYNAYAEAGEDLDFAKPAEFMWPVAEAPFYAFQLVSGVLNTCGGIRINTEAQVVDPRGQVIDGLYAAGVCSSGWDGEIYGGGTCQTVGMWGGSRAARHAIVHKLGGSVAADWMGTEKSMDHLPQ
ncbi:MAG: FAD-binding protein [Bifidobacteriaceae bacterium]|jgi:fumarate reductase flavoprotein subunit|nr:FAD-binding protein [Bifidobacteriaceae bacterium]